MQSLKTSRITSVSVPAVAICDNENSVLTIWPKFFYDGQYVSSGKCTVTREDELNKELRKLEAICEAGGTNENSSSFFCFEIIVQPTLANERDGNIIGIAAIKMHKIRKS